jgi:hypothetical protein
MPGFGGEFGVGEKAQRVEPVVERHDEDAARREARAVVARLGAGAHGGAAAVNPDHRGQARTVSRRGRSPDVEIEAILGDAGDGRVDVVEQDALQRVHAKGARRADARPGRNRLRWTPTQRADRRRRIGNALVNADAACIRLGDRERTAFDGKIFRHYAVLMAAASPS